MRMGQPVHTRTIYPLYVDDKLVLPAGTEVEGRIIALQPAPKQRRTDAKLGGDFTPLHTPRIEFDRLILGNGTIQEIDALPASDGVDVVRFQATGAASHQSLTRKLWAEAVGREKEAVRTFTAPGKGERARRMLYGELPYHPELLLAGTQYEVELKEHLAPVKLLAAPSDKQAEEFAGHDRVSETVTLAATLEDDISSHDAVRGTKVRAKVIEPLFDKSGLLKVPQGSELIGEVTQAHPAGKWGKDGTLRFSFRELRFPQGFAQRVHGAAAAIDAPHSANLQLDAEGGVRHRPKGIAAPLAMGLLAASTIHEDEVTVLHTGGASNGFALVGRVAAIAAKSNYVGAAFGFYGTGRAFYSRYIAHGKDVEFPKDTRIEVLLAPERVNSLPSPK
jgi:hypothetical protein